DAFGRAHRLRIACALGAHRRIARLDDGFKRARFVCSVTLHGLDQVRDQIVALLQLDVDVGESLVAVLTKRDEAVVNADQQHRQNGDDDEDDNQSHGDPFPDERITLSGTFWPTLSNHVAEPARAREALGRQLAGAAALAAKILPLRHGANATGAVLPGKPLRLIEHLHVGKPAIVIALQLYALAAVHLRNLAQREDQELLALADHRHLIAFNLSRLHGAAVQNLLTRRSEEHTSE